MIMASSFSLAATLVPSPWPCLHHHHPKFSSFTFQLYNKNTPSTRRLKIRCPKVVVSCDSSGADDNTKRRSKLEVGAPIIFIEAPKMIKSDTAISCLRVNAGLIKPGDVGRIMSRKPMDVWAIRLSIGTYLIDGKYFKPLEIDEQ